MFSSKREAPILEEEEPGAGHEGKERSPGTWRQFLVPRYSRYRNGTVIFYGGRQYELSQDLIRKHLRDFRVRHKASFFCCAVGNGTHATPDMNEKSSPDVQLMMRAIEVQSACVLHLWDQLLFTIKNGLYDSRVQEPSEGYCSNSLDVLMVNELDALYNLDKHLERLDPLYDSMFVKRLVDHGCTCPACKPAANFMMDLKFLALKYHAHLEPSLFERGFCELDICRSCMPRGYKGRGLPAKRCYQCVQSARR